MIQPPPTLDVRKITEPILRNYNEQVIHFIEILKGISCQLVYDGPSDFREHILEKTTYDCSIRYSYGKKYKFLKSIFPIMIGSNLDTCIRKRGLREFDSDDWINNNNMDDSFETADIAITFFLINGIVRQLPYFFTNDPTNTHVIRNTIVRCYTYDSNDRGKEMSYYVDSFLGNKRGDMVVSLNDGSKNSQVQGFFDECPYPIDPVVYMSQLYKQGYFDIDHIANKIVVSPGHLYVKLFVKYLYQPLKDRKLSLVKQKYSMVIKSINTGNLLHVLSRKTLYQKETRSPPKMVSVPVENHREIGSNGEIYVEKNTGCYREVNMQTYPLNPYLSHLIVRQISSKVKNCSTVPFHDSYKGFLCLLGNFETKSVGRTNIMVKNTYVSTHCQMSHVYALLKLKPCSWNGCRYVVVNEACIPVSERCFNGIQLIHLKRKLSYVECYVNGQFIHIRYKAGILFKKMGSIWVTARDESYWAFELFRLTSKEQIVNKYGYDYITGHHVDLNPYFRHNYFPKNILAFNALKNSVLATDGRYSRYFMENISAYTELTPNHTVVCSPVDDFSAHFTMHIPRVRVVYMSFYGNNQEDCIVVRKNLRVFDAHRFYTLRVKFKPLSSSAVVVFHPVRGDPCDDDDFVGSVVCHSLEEDDDDHLQAMHVSNHVSVVQKSDRVLDVHFIKCKCSVVEYNLNRTRLIVILEKYHKSATGDKLCSLHGQKGVMRLEEEMPILDGNVVPDLIVNPYCIFRMTNGQFREGLEKGAGKDALTVQIGDVLMDGYRIFYASTMYFNVLYWADEHFYGPTCWIKDLITIQPGKGRARKGGMRHGNMEVNNGLRGNGIAACAEEKLLEHSDRVVRNGIPIPNSYQLCKEDAKFFKCHFRYETQPCIVEEQEEYRYYNRKRKNKQKEE